MRSTTFLKVQNPFTYCRHFHPSSSHFHSSMTLLLTTSLRCHLRPCYASSSSFLSPISIRSFVTFSSASSSNISTETAEKISAPENSHIIVTYQRRNHEEKQQNDDPTMLPTSGIVLWTLNRTSAANAIGRTMLSQLQSCIQQVQRDMEEDRVRCIILSSVSKKVFSAGADLRERSTMTPIQASAYVSELRDTFQLLANLPIPLIASVEGVAVGGGLELALTADIIVAGSKSTFGLPETSLAIIPGAGGSVRLPRKIGMSRAKEMIFTAQKINATTAYEYGLVEHVVEEGHTLDKSIEIALAICKNGPLAIQASKKALNTGVQTISLIEALDVERICYESIIPTTDRLEGLAAFNEKRTPVYTGK